MTTKTFEEELAEAEKENKDEKFAFAKPETGANTSIQPNDPKNPNGNTGGGDKTNGQTTHPSGRTQK